MKNYVITTPANVSTSAGIRALHKLAADLRDYGCSARVINDLRAGDGNSVDNDREIVVYPDCYNGNVLGAKNVVRLIFMYVGYFAGTDKDFPESERLFYNSPDMVHRGRDPENILGVPMIKEDRFIYPRPGLRRIGSCCLAMKYFGHHGHVPPDLPPGCIPIDKCINLSDLFHRVERLITYDNSAINIEAALAGVEVEFRPNAATPHLHQYQDFDWSTVDSIRRSYERQKWRYYTHNLPAFIEKTQRMFS